MWETGTGKHYVLDKRWEGEQDDDDDDDEQEEEEEEEEDGDAPFEAFFEENTHLDDNYIRSEDVFVVLDEMGAAGLGDDESSEEEFDLGLPKPQVLPPYWSVH